jgi:hypothetical protein
MKVLIINYNRLTLPVNIATWVSERGCEPVFIDNNSNYPPLLEYYHDCPYKVMHMNKNYGKNVIWNPETTIFKRLGITGNYIVTDPDLDLTGIPDNFLEVLEEGLKRYPQFDKCGFSLEINDVTNTGVYCDGQSIREWEVQFWEKPLDDTYFEAWIDTTFALYKSKEFTMNGIRTNRPYIAKHVPWYYKGFTDMPEDERYYFESVVKESFTRNII